uniref:SHSP domain-containing protein n=1 Tax=Bursaphelenchus xylophilus TaxID=6326 RepID=A0A1I7RR35_BURXY
MALARRHYDDDWFDRDPFWRDTWRDRLEREWEDWPRDWPRPRELVSRFRRDSDKWWRDWPSDWPRMDQIMPKFSSHLDRFDSNWRDDPFWRDLYPRWAEPIFKDGLDVRTKIHNDRNRFSVEIDAYQFRPEELQVKTLDDTLLIEGRHEDVKDSDNYTKMYFVRKYQLPPDVHPQDITSSIDSSGRLNVEAKKPYAAIEGRERTIPIEGGSARVGSRASSYVRDRNDSGRASYDRGDGIRQRGKCCAFIRNLFKPRARNIRIQPARNANFYSTPDLRYAEKYDLMENSRRDCLVDDRCRDCYYCCDRICGRRCSRLSAHDEYDCYGYRSQSRNGDYHGSAYNQSDAHRNGFNNEFTHHSRDGSGSHHESRRSAFREEFRGSTPPPLVTHSVPITESYSRSASRSSKREYSSSGADYRAPSPLEPLRSSFRRPGDEHFLRPSAELGDRSRSGSSRSVRISRREEVH